MLTKLKNLNNISKELLETIPVLEPGKTAILQMLTKTFDIDADTGAKKEFYRKEQVPLRDVIKDVNGARVNIGVPKEVNNDEVLSFDFFMPGKDAGVFNGRHVFTGGNMKDEEIFTYCWISNLNASNPNRDKSVTPLFEFLNIEKINKARRYQVNQLREALNIVEEFKDEECFEACAALGLGVFTDAETAFATLEDFIAKDHETFMKVYLSPLRVPKSVISRAVDAGIIKWDIATSKVLMCQGNSVIAFLEGDQEKDWVERFAEWTMIGKGQEAIRSIRQQLDKANKPLNAKK